MLWAPGVVCTYRYVRPREVIGRSACSPAPAPEEVPLAELPRQSQRRPELRRRAPLQAEAEPLVEAARARRADNGHDCMREKPLEICDTRALVGPARSTGAPGT